MWRIRRKSSGDELVCELWIGVWRNDSSCNHISAERILRASSYLPSAEEIKVADAAPVSTVLYFILSPYADEAL